MESSGISIPTNQDKIWVYWLLIVNTNTLRFSSLPLIDRHQHCFPMCSAESVVTCCYLLLRKFYILNQIRSLKQYCTCLATNLGNYLSPICEVLASFCDVVCQRSLWLIFFCLSWTLKIANRVRLRRKVFPKTKISNSN